MIQLLFLLPSWINPSLKAALSDITYSMANFSYLANSWTHKLFELLDFLSDIRENICLGIYLHILGHKNQIQNVNTRISLHNISFANKMHYLIE